MVPLPLLTTSPIADAPREPGRPVLSEASRGLLNHLRIVGLRCRASARTDLFKACALLTTDKSAAQSAYVETLMRCLSQAIGKRPTILRPTTEELSFDEAWLLRLIGAAGTGDTNSFTFLLHSRVTPEARRNITFLTKQISEQFSQL